MRRAKKFLPILLIPLLFVGSTARAKDPASPVPGGITVGQFALKVVTLAEDDPGVRASLTADQAMARLKMAGLSFRGASGDPLTEGDRSAFFFAVAKGLMDSITPPPPGFDTCAAKPTVPECVSCCRALSGGSNDKCGRACGRANAAANHASPSEPTP